MHRICIGNFLCGNQISCAIYDQTFAGPFASGFIGKRAGKNQDALFLQQPLVFEMLEKPACEFVQRYRRPGANHKQLLGENPFTSRPLGIIGPTGHSMLR